MLLYFKTEPIHDVFFRCFVCDTLSFHSQTRMLLGLLSAYLRYRSLRPVCLLPTGQPPSGADGRSTLQLPTKIPVANPPHLKNRRGHFESTEGWFCGFAVWSIPLLPWPPSLASHWSIKNSDSRSCLLRSWCNSYGLWPRKLDKIGKFLKIPRWFQAAAF